MAEDWNAFEDLITPADAPIPSDAFNAIRDDINAGFEARNPDRNYMGITRRINVGRREGDLTDREAERLERMLENARSYGAHDFLTDMFAPREDPRYSDSGEISWMNTHDFGDAADIARALSSTPDPERQLGIIQTAIPEMEVRRDAEGRPVLRHPRNPHFGEDSDEGWFYLNEPGLSMQDLMTFLTEGAWYAPGAFFSRGAATTGGRMLRGATTAGGTSMAQDLAAAAQGSGQGIDMGRAAFAAGAGGLAEGIAPAIGGLTRTLRGQRPLPTPGQVPMGPTGGNTMYQAGRAIGNVGRAARNMTGESLDLSPSNAERLARMREQGVRFNRAQLEQDPAMMATLDDARGGSYGRGPEEAIRRQDVRQAREVAALGNRERSRFGDSIDLESEVDPRIQTGERVRDDLATAHLAQRETTDALYDQTRQFPAARFTGESMEGLENRIVSGLETDGLILDADLTPQTIRALEDINSLTTRFNEGSPLEYAQDFERVRRLLAQRAEAATQGSDRRGVQNVARQFREWVDEAADSQLFDAPPEFFETYAQARDARATLGRLFEPRGRPGSIASRVGQTMGRITEDGRSANEVANWLMGNGRLGNNNMSLALTSHLKENFPEQFQMTREAVAARLLFGDNPSMRQALLNPTDANINQVRSAYNSIYRRLDRELSGSAEYLDELFTPEELSRLRNYRNTLRDIIGDTTPANLRNRSGSGSVVARVGWTLWNAIYGGSGARLLSGAALRSPGELAGGQAARAAMGEVTDFALYDAPLFSTGVREAGALSGTNATDPRRAVEEGVE